MHLNADVNASIYQRSTVYWSNLMTQISKFLCCYFLEFLFQSFLDIVILHFLGSKLYFSCLCIFVFILFCFVLKVVKAFHLCFCKFYAKGQKEGYIPLYININLILHAYQNQFLNTVYNDESVLNTFLNFCIRIKTSSQPNTTRENNCAKNNKITVQRFKDKHLVHPPLVLTASS